MSQQKYAWLLALSMISLRQRLEDNDQDDPFPSVMEEVTAVAGRLRESERQAANDLAAVMFILLLLLWWSCAKHRAIFCGFHSELREINEAAFFSWIACIPHEMGAAGFQPLPPSSDKSITSPQPNRR